jgi:beta-aspartyl-peptidase (threonine type)
MTALTVAEAGRRRPPVLIVHGGAGPRTPADVDGPRRQAFRDAVSAALAAGWDDLSSGAGAVAAVVTAVVVLEDSGALNAGRGSVRTSAGTVEMDAAVVAGTTRDVGAVAAVQAVRNPVRVARAVLDDRWVLLAGPGADRYALDGGYEPADPDWFVPDGPARTADPPSGDTVGAVAVDAAGRTAAATSTGGVRGQIPGRVGDSPVIGAGLWADDRTVAVSTTGTGEAFLRALAAHHVHLLVAGGAEIADASAAALGEVRAVGGHGGLIAVTPAGDHAVMATTPLMIRGIVSEGEPAAVQLFAAN